MAKNEKALTKDRKANMARETVCLRKQVDVLESFKKKLVLAEKTIAEQKMEIESLYHENAKMTDAFNVKRAS